MLFRSGLCGVGDAQRRPVALVAPHGLLLLDEPQTVPDLGQHADALRHVVGATGHPGRRGVVPGLDPQVLVEISAEAFFKLSTKFSGTGSSITSSG